MDGDDRVSAIVLAAEHLLDLAGLDFLIEGIEGARDVGFDRFAGVGPLEEDGEIVDFAPERHDEVAVLLEPAAALEDSLCFGLVFPEIRRGRARLESGQLFFRA